MVIDDKVDKTIAEDDSISISDDSAQTEAVKHLLQVKERKKGQLTSDIEVKTELSEDQCSLHTQGIMLGHIFELDEENFTSKNLVTAIVDQKERKLVSLKRQSRREIVDVARNPDMNTVVPGENEGFVKRFFRGKRQ